ncbi:ABC transporter ATP-binding protein [Fictibacillus fluitans]|uniref:ABC transporter ATP-binding protein n=1 Tax=Fictibacillus fluitans TaxID=3058422 RepID=A0ABT8HZA8_9BACL|nr:ABC transporter ATP-binding protein [Fictibacillus sp. NE201]MDN4525800.1 ABC transporter ATP-binding protein [Fictibacillus sp. NE201]
MNEVVSVQHVSKSFKNEKAVDDVSFGIQAGEIVAILGPNGAGKTTTILMMLGLMEPEAGFSTLFGSNPKSRKVRERIGAMFQEVSVMDGLTCREILALVRSYYPNPLPVSELTALTGLEEKDLKKRAEKLSGGQKRRLNFALALAGDPDLLFFDEPTVGMDISARKSFWDTIRLLKNRGKTIIFTTHYLQEADDVAERIIMFHKGRIVADGKPEVLKNKLARQTVSFVAENRMPLEECWKLPDVKDVYRLGERIYILSDDSDRVLEALFQHKWDIRNIQTEQGKLEEAFDHLTRSGKREVG